MSTVRFENVEIDLLTTELRRDGAHHAATVTVLRALHDLTF